MGEGGNCDEQNNNIITRSNGEHEEHFNVCIRAIN